MGKLSGNPVTPLYLKRSMPWMLKRSMPWAFTIGPCFAMNKAFSVSTLTKHYYTHRDKCPQNFEFATFYDVYCKELN